jgi:hypothetical protein
MLFRTDKLRGAVIGPFHSEETAERLKPLIEW